jgi:hypothetical protein
VNRTLEAFRVLQVQVPQKIGHFEHVYEPEMVIELMKSVCGSEVFALALVAGPKAYGPGHQPMYWVLLGFPSVVKDEGKHGIKHILR